MVFTGVMLQTIGYIGLATIAVALTNEVVRRKLEIVESILFVSIYSLGVGWLLVYIGR